MFNLIRFGTLDFKNEERKAIQDLISVPDPQLTMGRKVHEFETLFANWIGSKYSVMVNSGTSALITAIKAYRPKSLYTSALTYCATWNAIINEVPMYLEDVGNDFVVHCDPVEHGYLDHMIVHLFGKPCRYGIGIEDASEAIGSKLQGKKLGTLDDIGCFSFYVAHQINTIEGGMVVTNNKDLYEKCLSIRDNGRICICPICTLKTKGICSKKFSEDFIERRWEQNGSGFNFKPTEFQGALGVVKMSKIDSICKRRHEIFESYANAFGTLKEEDDEYIVPLAYPIKVKDPQKALEYLLDKGIECRGMFPAFSKCYPNAYRLSQSHIMIPSHQDISDDEVDYIIKMVKQCL